MKISCECGNIIPDQTDYLPYKAYFISDLDWFNFWDKVDEAIESDNLNKEKLQMDLRGLEKSQIAYQCIKCGKLFLTDNKSEVHKFSVDFEQTSKALSVFDTRK